MIRHAALAMCLAGSLVAGCGPAAKPTGNLQGSVTFEGAPVKDATVQLHSAKTGEGAAAKVGDDGKFSFAPVTVGEYQAAVIPVDKAPEAGAGGKELPPKPPQRTDIPERYRTTAKSGLKVDVKSGNNTFDAKLTK